MNEPPENESLRQRLRMFWLHFRRANHRRVARAAIGGHLVYYSLCFVEAHGSYGYAAGFCGVLLVLEVVMGGNDENES